MKIEKLFNKPKIIGVIADVNQGKSNFVYHLITLIKKRVSLVTYGLRKIVGGRVISSLEELEQIKDSVIVIDEFFSLFDLDNRHKRKLIENTLRMINHNNNILILVGLPENFKKFICGKLDEVFFKKVTYGDFINGGRAKKIIMSYMGREKGSYILDVGVGEALHYDGLHYELIKVPYLKEFDTKAKNKTLLKTCGKM